MKYKISKKSDKQKLTDKTLDIIKQIMVIKRGYKDELSGKYGNRLGVFHILSKGSHPRLTLYGPNLLLVNWLPLHYWHHHDPEKNRKFVEPLLKRKLGNDYRDDLLIAEKIQPRLSMHQINLEYEARKQELEELKRRP